MKAVRFHEHGGIDALKYESVPDPVAGPGEVVVRVRACALNHLDLWLRRGLPGIPIPLPHISGSDVAGVIESVGPGVHHLEAGKPTVVCPGISCGHCEMCLGGLDNLCGRYYVLGTANDGGCAERVLVPAVNALPCPEGTDYAEAASIPLVFMTAWHMLVARCAISSRDTVLVLGAGSGVGSAAIQIARFFRARVIATARGDAKLEKARALGADHVVDHSRGPLHREVKRLTGGRGADIVFEHVGSATWEESLRSLAHHGRLVTCGATTGFDAHVDLRHLFARQISILGSTMGTKGELLEVLRLVRGGHLRPVIDRILPLASAAEAQRVMENREHFGKVVLVPAEESG